MAAVGRTFPTITGSTPIKWAMGIKGRTGMTATMTMTYSATSIKKVAGNGQTRTNIPEGNYVPIAYDRYRCIFDGSFGAAWLPQCAFSLFSAVL
jgi:hypothetical protein